MTQFLHQATAMAIAIPWVFSKNSQAKKSGQCRSEIRLRILVSSSGREELK